MMVSRGCRRNTTWRCPRRSQRLLRRWRRERERARRRPVRRRRQMMRRHARSSTLLETAQLLPPRPTRPAPPVRSRSTPYGASSPSPSPSYRTRTTARAILFSSSECRLKRRRRSSRPQRRRVGRPHVMPSRLYSTRSATIRRLQPQRLQPPLRRRRRRLTMGGRWSRALHRTKLPRVGTIQKAENGLRGTTSLCAVRRPRRRGRRIASGRGHALLSTP